MNWITSNKLSLLTILCTFIFIPLYSLATNTASNKIDAVVTPQVFEKAKKNTD